MSASVLIMAGGTGGHVFPALAVAQALRGRSLDVAWLGTRRGLEARVVPAAGIPLQCIAAAGLRGTGLRRRMGAPLMLARALAQAAAILRRLRPAVVLGMGGFASGPGGLAARLMGIPLVIHEQNAVAGLTNRWLSRLAVRVLEAFPGTFPAARHAEPTGNPVRTAIATLPEPARRLSGRTGPPRLLVLGGSQGALALNDMVPRALAGMAPERRPEVRHQAGGRHLEPATGAYREAGVAARVEPFIDDMAGAYGWADLVLARAGALTVAELAAAGVGAVLVPYPHAVDDHQTANGRYLESRGAAVILQQRELDGDRLRDALDGLLQDRGRLLAMARAARAAARPEAAERVAEVCAAVMRGGHA